MLPLRVAGDCCGYGSVVQALSHLGIAIELKGMSEACDDKQLLLRAVCCRARVQVCKSAILNDLRDRRTLEDIDLYEAGFPCQAFSCAGKQLGVSDPRGNLFIDGVKSICRQKPRMVLLEEVTEIACDPKFGKLWSFLLDSLSQHGYSFSWRIMNSEHNGLSQMRQRVYLIAVSGDVRQRMQRPLDWVWPEHLPPLSVKHFLKMDIGGQMRRSISGTWKANMKQVRKVCKQKRYSLDPRAQLVVADVGGSTANISIDRFPTITASRGSQCAYWLPSLGRLSDLEELARIQGVDSRFFQAMCQAGVGRGCIGHAVGNAMSIAVVERILGRLSFAAGYLPSLPPDRWEQTSFQLLLNPELNFWEEVSKRSRLQ